MLSVPELQDELRSAVQAMARRPLHELLNQQGILPVQARDLALQALRRGVRFGPQEQQEVVRQLCAGMECAPPASLEGDWIATLPEHLRAMARQRWDHLRLQKVLEDRYGERVEAHFLERREDLEQVVFRLMRLPHQGLAEELYLRLVDDDASFGDLASRYSVGDESFTRGIVGPMDMAQLHPTRRGVLRTLAVGELHPPFLLEQSILLVRVQHRRAATLNEAMRHRLLEELLQPDLQAGIEAGLANLEGSLATVHKPRTPELLLVGG